MNRRLAHPQHRALCARRGAWWRKITSSLADEARVERASASCAAEILSLLRHPGAVATETNPNTRALRARACGSSLAGRRRTGQAQQDGLPPSASPTLARQHKNAEAEVRHLRHPDDSRASNRPDHGGGALIGTTEFDIFSIDPATCAEELRRTRKSGLHLPTNRGAATSDGHAFADRDGGCWPTISRPASGCGRRRIAVCEEAEAVPAAPMPGRGSSHRQAGATSRAKGVCSAHPRRQDRVEFFLCQVRGRCRSRPQGASPLDNSTWKKTARRAD